MFKGRQRIFRPGEEITPTELERGIIVWKNVPAFILFWVVVYLISQVWRWGYVNMSGALDHHLRPLIDRLLS